MCKASKQRCWCYYRLGVIILLVSESFWTPNCMVGLANMFWQSGFSFLQRETAFWFYFKRVPNWRSVCYGFVCLLWFDMSVIYVFGVFARDGIKRVGPLSPQYMILRFRENMPQCPKNVWGTLTLWLAKIFFLKWMGQVQNQQPIQYLLPLIKTLHRGIKMLRLESIFVWHSDFFFSFLLINVFVTD